MRKIITLLIISVILSCQNTTSPVQPKLGEEFEIEFGKQITIPEEGISLQFSDVLEDSRCPKGVTCVWAGNAEIVIQLNDAEANLNTYLEPKQTNIHEYKVQLLSLNPYPKYNVELENKDYSAKLLITKN
ncbi:hypothetical protein LQ318_01520 [Aliifodinibius salicampi]|uniref:Uncharacterized protein n=1 Tax=Fodinibius salicampi TaxID=1920655 RepID=A0ABT3PUN9_9BACT|nr:hypothetical protein [Fodinibius salicampi]MCW9711570.1 hypothetical protein [Fodinibius salicampi]